MRSFREAAIETGAKPKGGSPADEVTNRAGSELSSRQVMHEVTELLKAIGSLAWPLVVLVLVYYFRREVSQLLRRLQEGEVLGQKLKLSEDLDQLKKQTDVLEAQANVGPVIAPDATVSERNIEEASGHEDKFAMELLREAVKSPKVALIALSMQLEKELRQLMASKGWHVIAKMPANLAIQELEKWKVLSASITSSMEVFWDIRNKVIHGGRATDDETLRAIDLGFTLLKVLRALPHERKFVHHPGVPVYADSGCKSERQGVKGIILKCISPGGSSVRYQILPTTKRDYKNGQELTWEWNQLNKWGESWYKDPDTGEVKRGWLASAEFVGQPLENLS